MLQEKLSSLGLALTAATGLAMVGTPFQLWADDAAPAADKSQYSLFNVTPADQLRPLALDADDGVVDPTTVDAAHLEVQGDLVDYYRYSKTYSVYGWSEKLTEDHFSWAPRVTLGLCNNVDLFVHPSFETTSRSYAGAFGASRDTSEYEGINVGTKFNLWGNDGGLTAFSVAPYVSFPNNGGPVLGGGDISFAVRLPAQFYLKFMSDPYAFSDHDTVYFGMENSMSLHKSFGPSFDTYAYLNTVWQSDSEPWYGYAGFGAGYLVNRNLEFFVGMGFGLTSEAYDYNPRLGLAWRF
jgi:hypothetical protein